EGIDPFHYHKDGEGNDSKVDDCLDGTTVGDGHRRCIGGGFFGVDSALAEVDATTEQADGRHGHVAHDGRDDLAKGGADVATDRQVHRLSLFSKLFEVLASYNC